MVLHADPVLQCLAQILPQIVFRIIIHQSAGIHPHPAILLNYHFTEGTHKAAPCIFGMILSHAVGRDIRSVTVTPRWQEIRERDKINIARDLALCQLFTVLRFNFGVSSPSFI